MPILLNIATLSRYGMSVNKQSTHFKVQFPQTKLMVALLADGMRYKGNPAKKSN